MTKHGTGIEWTHIPGYKGESWNPVVGCEIVSPGCKNCYAMSMARRINRTNPGSHYDGTVRLEKEKPIWTGKIKPAPDHTWSQPFRWKEPRAIFVNSMGDLFHKDVPDELIDRVLATAALCPQHIFIILTKRAWEMRLYMSGIDDNKGGRLEGFRDAIVEGMAQSIYAKQTGEDPSWWLAVQLPLPNVWLGVSAETQSWLDSRAPHLLATPAAIRFISAEPLLSDLRLAPYITPPRQWDNGDLNNYPYDYPKHQLDWVIAGGESGKYARPSHPDWFRSLRDQCQAAGVAYFFKQWGEWVSVSEVEGPGRHYQFPDYSTVRRTGKKRAGNRLDGKQYQQWPEIA